jgi:hypothetical protein
VTPSSLVVTVTVEDGVGARWVTESCPLRLGSGCASRLAPPGPRALSTRVACGDGASSPACHVLVRLLPDDGRGRSWWFDPTDGPQRATFPGAEGSWGERVLVEVWHRPIPLFVEDGASLVCVDDGLRRPGRAPADSLAGGVSLRCGLDPRRPQLCVEPDGRWPEALGEQVSCGGSVFTLVRTHGAVALVPGGAPVAVDVEPGPCTDVLGRPWTGVGVDAAGSSAAVGAEGEGFCGTPTRAVRVLVAR